MSAAEYVLRSIFIAVVTDATMRTLPYSDPQATQSTRTGPLQTGRASNTGERFIDFDIAHAKPHGFVSKLCLEVGPRCVIDGFREAGFRQLRTRHVSHDDQNRSKHNGGTEFMG